VVTRTTAVSGLENSKRRSKSFLFRLVQYSHYLDDGMFLGEHQQELGSHNPLCGVQPNGFTELFRGDSSKQGPEHSLPGPEVDSDGNYCSSTPRPAMACVSPGRRRCGGRGCRSRDSAPLSWTMNTLALQIKKKLTSSGHMMRFGVLCFVPVG
jgi:hypothetical protein